MLFSNEQIKENVSFEDFNSVNIVNWLQVSLLAAVLFSVTR